MQALCQNGEGLAGDFELSSFWLKDTFDRASEDDQTSVFDYIDDEWFEYSYSNIQKVAENDYYSGDGSVEYKVAYITVELNLLHALVNGNKRTSLLVLFALLHFNDLRDAIDKDWEVYYQAAKKIATGGNAKREESIADLCQLLKQ